MVFFPSNFAWIRCLGWSRLALAVAALMMAVLRGGLSGAQAVIPAVYLVYSMVMAIRPAKEQPGALGLLELFGDTVFLLILAARGTDALSVALSTAFLLFVLAEAIWRHTSREVVLVAVVAAAFNVLMPAGAAGLPPHALLVGGVLGWVFSVTRQRLQEQVRKAQADSAEARAAIVKALDAERQRIASDFHDGPLQNFISLQMRLEILRKLLERDATAGKEELKQLQTLAQQQVRELRAFLRGMRPLEVEGGNIIASARRAAETFHKESGIPVTFVSGATQTMLSPEVAQEVLQMLREALHNVQKHAGATRVAVAMENSDQMLEMSVDDNGHGFNFVGSYSLEELELLKLGPASLKRRARSLNADLVLDSRPGRGAGLKIRIPVQ